MPGSFYLRCCCSSAALPLFPDCTRSFYPGSPALGAWAHAGPRLCPYLCPYLVLLVMCFFMRCLRENGKAGKSIQLVSASKGLLRTGEISPAWQEARRAAHVVLLQHLEMVTVKGS